MYFCVTHLIVYKVLAVQSFPIKTIVKSESLFTFNVRFDLVIPEMGRELYRGQRTLVRC